jgi:multiple sugar transport system permease protein
MAHNRYLRRNAVAYIFTTPSLLIISFLLLYPIIQSCIMSFTYWYLVLPKKGHPFVGLGNFRDVLSSSSFIRMIIITALYTIVSVAGKMMAGLGTALLLNRDFVGRAIVRALIIIPWAMPTLVVCIVFRLALDQDYGMINAILRSLGFIHKTIPFLDNPTLALFSVIAIAVWRYFPFVTLMLLAALQGIPEDLYEAASLDGAGAWRKFLHISWPWIRPVWTIVLLLQLVWTVKEFELVYLITRGGPGNSTALIGIDVYLNAFRFTRLGTASAEGMFLVAFSLIFGVIYYRFSGGKRSI